MGRVEPPPPCRYALTSAMTVLHCRNACRTFTFGQRLEAVTIIWVSTRTLGSAVPDPRKYTGGRGHAEGKPTAATDSSKGRVGGRQ